jgi:hypothetical protein
MAGLAPRQVGKGLLMIPRAIPAPPITKPPKVDHQLTPVA